MMAKLLLWIVLNLKIDLLLKRIRAVLVQAEVERYNRRLHTPLKFVEQGFNGVKIISQDGNISKFSIHNTSHLKSDTLIDCTGGVNIGKYCHVARGLTIFSSNHNFKSSQYIPYDKQEVNRPVIIGDAVWIGANVTIAPGAKIGNGVIISMGAVVFGEIPDCAIIRGNPAVIIGYRDKDNFYKLYTENKFY